MQTHMQKKTQVQIASYHKLSEKQKATLHIMALVCFSLKEEALQACLGKITSLFEKQKEINVRELLSGLRKTILVRSYSSYCDEISPSLLHFLTLEALKSPHSSQYFKAIQEVWAQRFGKKDFKTTGYLSREERFFREYYTAQDQNAHKKKFDLRLALYKGEEDTFLSLAKTFSSREIEIFLETLFLYEPLAIEWLETLPLPAQHIIFHLKLYTFVLKGGLLDQISALLAHYLPLRDQARYENFNGALLPYDILSGNLEKAEETLKDADTSSYSLQALLGMMAFLRGQNQQAILFFDQAHKSMRKDMGRRNVLLGSHETLCYLLSLFKSQDKHHHKKIQTLLDLENTLGRSKKSAMSLQNVLWKLQGHDAKIGKHVSIDYGAMDPLNGAIVALSDLWLEEEGEPRVNIQSCKRQFETYKNILPLVGKVFAEILQKQEPKNEGIKSYLDAFKNPLNGGLPSLLDCVHIQEAWQRKLDTLDHFFETLTPDSKSTKIPEGISKRLLWQFNPKTQELFPLEQSQTAKGKWTKGRPLTLKRLYETPLHFNYLTAEDKRVVQTLQKETIGWRGRSVDYEWDDVKTPLALIGHPYVFNAEHPNLHIELVSAFPELIVKKMAQGQFHISLSHHASEQAVFIEQETPTLYRVIEFPKSWIPLEEILGSKGLKVPAAAKDHVLSLIQKASPVLPIHSELLSLDVPVQEGDVTLHLHLTPLEQGFKLMLFVRPFGNKGPYCRPGQGRPSLSLFLEGQPFKVNRLLKEERQKADELIEACPRLRFSSEGQDEWTLEDPQDCLEALEELQIAQKTHLLKLEWPEGQKLSLTKPASFDNLFLNIRQKGEWLHLKGEVKIDESTVIDFQRLLHLLDQAQGRFIPLEGNKYISLTAHLKKQLQELKAFTEQTADGPKIHEFGSFCLKHLTDNVSHVDGDKGWKDKLKIFKEAEAFQPTLPSTLQAELRDYQKEGFEWISRLSSLGMGACLADDMGLGKTLQALAVMLTHAPKGPCLVVAPTSVCHNWAAEIERFAPALNAYSLNEYSSSSKRKELLKSLTAMDVLICSYSLLQQEVELLTEKPWQMIVLDEAQAIKNATTKRFQAATKLKGHFKLALTGTPIENHAEDIWSLFRFITPGLLGSINTFRKRFLSDSSKKEGLKSLIKMFILRRTKSTVLQELPPRTDQTLLIDMSEEEFAFYETLRRQALAKISNLQDNQAGQRKIHILAEITKLRQACCHPQLAHKDISIPSSKLKAFFHLVEDLLENNHQALVFSQYISYLALVRETLDQKNIPYQYLDGSTPAHERKKQVQAFQEGQSPLFLLSLKAGGSGLNLTAADYVIHLDPWWNPAVEDQASDRAHRLGQTRPVTIYRLIMQNTIEEKIKNLHKAKRDLAEDLLDGSHISSKLSEEDLLKLMGGISEVSLDETPSAFENSDHIAKRY